MLRILLILTSMFLIQGLTAQEELSGTWRGTITRDLNGEEFPFTVEIEVKGKEFSGKTYVRSGEMFATMQVKGVIKGKKMLHFEETAVLEQRTQPGIEWCIKKGFLLLKKEDFKTILEGYWEGGTSFSDCLPGKIVLYKLYPQA